METTMKTRTAAEVVQAIYEAFDAHDVAAALALFDPEIEVSQSEALPWGGTHFGHEGAIHFFGTLMSRIETRVEIERLIVAGDTVVEIGKTCGHAVGSDREFAIDEAHVWTVRDGRAVRMQAFVDDAAMIEALDFKRT